MAEGGERDEFRDEASLLPHAAEPPKHAQRGVALRRALAATAALLPALALAALATLGPKHGAPAAAADLGRHPSSPPQSLVALESAYADKEGARFAAGQAVRLYAVGSSNTVWVPWLEELHLLLARLGFQLPLVPGTEKALTRPWQFPVCEDAGDYALLQTTRIGQVGWGSWGFAYEGCDGCTAGFRKIAGWPVSCHPAWGCPADSPQPLHISRIVDDASGSDVTLLSCWINDSKQFATGNTCFNHANVSRVDTAAISLETLLRMIRTIHGRNPNIWVVVLALYPDEYTLSRVVDRETLPMINEINRRVREGLAHEPKTLFADYSFPPGVEMFQSLHVGHPNCRAAKLMANSVVDVLFRAGVLGRGLAQKSGEAACPSLGAKADCASLDQACCQRAALCRVLAGGQCVDYGPGS